MEECIECFDIARVQGVCKLCDKPVCGNCIRAHVEYHDSIRESIVKSLDSSIRSLSE